MRALCPNRGPAYQGGMACLLNRLDVRVYLRAAGTRLAFALLVVCGVVGGPVAAQEVETDPPRGALEEGMDLLGQGMDRFLEGLLDEITPELERIGPELRGFARDMGPMLGELADLIDDIGRYHPPEILPNGDIILRRKEPDAPEATPDPAPRPQGEIEI